MLRWTECWNRGICFDLQVTKQGSGSSHSNLWPVRGLSPKPNSIIRTSAFCPYFVALRVQLIKIFLIDLFICVNEIYLFIYSRLWVFFYQSLVKKENTAIFQWKNYYQIFKFFKEANNLFLFKIIYLKCCYIL